MLGAEITFISAMKQSISGMEIKFLHLKDALLAMSTTTWNKVEYNWFMNIYLFNFNMCKLNEKQLLPTSLVVQLSLGWRNYVGKGKRGVAVQFTLFSFSKFLSKLDSSDTDLVLVTKLLYL